MSSVKMPGEGNNGADISGGMPVKPEPPSDPYGDVWYHGSPNMFDTLDEGSTVTRWRALAEAFSHKPTALGFETYGEGNISHNGAEDGILYIVDEPVEIGADVYEHPRTTMGPGAEFLTRRPLKMRKIAELPVKNGAKQSEK